MNLKDLGVVLNNEKLPDFFKVEECPVWAEWVAVDSTGLVCYFSDEPTIDTGCDEWNCRKTNSKIQLVEIEGKGIRITVEDWKKAKVKRPSTGTAMLLGKCRDIHISLCKSKYMVSFECRADDSYDNDSYYLELTIDNDLAADVISRTLGCITVKWLGKDVHIEIEGSRIRSNLQSSLPESFLNAVIDVRLYSALSTAH